MKKEWKTPNLDVLDVHMTMAGPGLRIPDDLQTDPDPEDMQHHS